MLPYPSWSKNMLKLVTDVELVLVAVTGLVLKIDAKDVQVQVHGLSTFLEEQKTDQCVPVDGYEKSSDFWLYCTDFETRDSCTNSTNAEQGVCHWDSGSYAIYETILKVWTVVVMVVSIVSVVFAGSKKDARGGILVKAADLFLHYNFDKYDIERSARPDNSYRAIDDLPAGWVEKSDEKSGRPYYVNAVLGKSSWDRPQPRRYPAKKEDNKVDKVAEWFRKPLASRLYRIRKFIPKQCGDCCGIRREELMRRYTDRLHNPSRDLAALNDDQKTQAHEAFDLYDTNGSGSIDTNELTDALKAMGWTTPVLEVEAKKMISEADEDGNGELNIYEFLCMLGRTQAKIRPSLRSESREILTPPSVERYSEKHRRSFWVNPATGERSWHAETVENPLHKEIPPKWSRSSNGQADEVLEEGDV